MKRTSAGAVFLTVVVDLIGFGIVLPLLPLYAKEFQASPFEIGALIASFSAMQFLFAPVWGRVSDRVGRRPVLLVGLAGSIVFYTFFGFADSVTMLFVSRIGAGICGATISTSAAYIADVTPPEKRARGMALIGAAFGIGFTIGPVLGLYSAHLGEVLEKQGTLTHPWSRALPGIVAALVSLASFLWTFLALGEPARHAARDRKFFDLSALRGAHAPRSVVLLLGFSLLSVLAFSNFEATLSLMLLDRFRMEEKDMGKVFLFIGVTLGILAGYFGKWLDSLISRFTDIILALPLVIFAIGIVAACSTTAKGCLNGALKPGLPLVILIVALFSWPQPARLVRGATLSLREKEFVESARSLGASEWRIMFREILPNLMAPIIVWGSLLVPASILFEAYLSFLGLGVPGNVPSWGRMLSEAVEIFGVAWWFWLFPGVMLMLIVLAFNLLGDGLRDALDPRTGR